MSYNNAATYNYFESLMTASQRSFLWSCFWKTFKKTITWEEIDYKGKKYKYFVFLNDYETGYNQRNVSDKNVTILLEKKFSGSWMENRNFQTSILHTSGNSNATHYYHNNTFRSPREGTMSSSNMLYNVAENYPEFKTFAANRSEWEPLHLEYEEKREKARKSLNTVAAKKRAKVKKAVQFNVREQQAMAQTILQLYLNKIMKPLGMSLSKMKAYSYGGTKRFVDFVDFDWIGSKSYLLDITGATVDRSGEKLRAATEDTLGSNYIQDLILSEDETLRRFAVVFGGDVGALGNIDKDEKIRLAAQTISEREEV